MTRETVWIETLQPSAMSRIVILGFDREYMDINLFYPILLDEIEVKSRDEKIDEKIKSNFANFDILTRQPLNAAEKNFAVR